MDVLNKIIKSLYNAILDKLKENDTCGIKTLWFLDRRSYLPAKLKIKEMCQISKNFPLYIISYDLSNNSVDTQYVLCLSLSSVLYYFERYFFLLLMTMIYNISLAYLLIRRKFRNYLELPNLNCF